MRLPPYNDASPAVGRAFEAGRAIVLEHRVLLLRSDAASARRAIVDGDSGVALGYARWQPERRRAWWRVFARGVLEVHEQEDEPLLFTVRRAWSLLPRREVCDADRQPVGSLLGQDVHDRFGRTLAHLQDGVFRNPHQRILAELTATTDGLRLTFGDDIADEPFVKMLLLASALQRTL
jgi:hypothetical protein